MRTAFDGMCLQPSSNNTGFNKLLVKYSAEQNWDKLLCQSDSGMEVLIHLDDLFCGFKITCRIKSIINRFRIHMFTEKIKMLT